MAKVDTNKVMQQAERSCVEHGVRLTSKRKHILEVLLTAEAPRSAYEIAELYRQKTEENIPVMSVYRMLDFLMQNSLVHKLASNNKFIACAHIACSHSHQTPQFLICDNCKQVREIGVDKQLIHALEESIEHNHFQLNSPQLELHGLCETCQQES